MADRYEIKGRLGRGGIGAVYQAFDHHLERDVAIKRLLPIEETKLNESAEKTLKLEAKALASLSHPNIVTIFEFGEDDKGPFVVFELIEGDTLKQVVRGGALTEGDFYDIADQILDALVSAHKNQLIHRDIKPANIMLSWLPSGKFQAKILDFGLSKFSQSPSKQTVDQHGAFLGSIDYIAPEQIDLKPLDHRADLYSLGCVLYFSLAQRPPFNGDNPADTMTNHLSGKSVPLQDLRPDLPAAVCGWVMKMISLDPDDRPATALAALEQLKLARKEASQPKTVAKLVVPIVEAQPSNTPRVLEHTQQIISTPSPSMEPVIPALKVKPDQTVRVSSETTSLKLAGIAKSKWTLMGLASCCLALTLCVVIFQGSRRSNEALPPVVDEILNPAPVVNTGLTNSGRASDLPKLPHVENLIAYYSVNGHVQKDEQDKIAAVENMAPDAHLYHLLQSPPDRAPRVSKDQSLVFSPGEKLVTPSLAFKEQVVESDKYTILIVYQVPKNRSGTVFRIDMKDSEGSTRKNAIRLMYKKQNLFLFSEENESFAVSAAAAQDYQVAIIELNAETAELSVSDVQGSGDQFKTDLWGPLAIQGYEIGNLIPVKEAASGSTIELPSIVIYSRLLSDSDKQEVAALMMQDLGAN